MSSGCPRKTDKKKTPFTGCCLLGNSKLSGNGIGLLVNTFRATQEFEQLTLLQGVPQSWWCFPGNWWSFPRNWWKTPPISRKKTTLGYTLLFYLFPEGIPWTRNLWPCLQAATAARWTKHWALPREWEANNIPLASNRVGCTKIAPLLGSHQNWGTKTGVLFDGTAFWLVLRENAIEPHVRPLSHYMPRWGLLSCSQSGLEEETSSWAIVLVAEQYTLHGNPVHPHGLPQGSGPNTGRRCQRLEKVLQGSILLRLREQAEREEVPGHALDRKTVRVAK